MKTITFALAQRLYLDKSFIQWTWQMFILLIVAFEILFPVKRNIFFVIENGFQA